MTLLIYILIGIFVLRSIIYFIGTRIELSKNKVNSTANLPFVSAIVPARNEEKYIETCIKSIYENDYPKDKFEIIVINDRSSDNTANILDSLSDKYQNLRVIHNNNEIAVKNLQGKPGALQLGINFAKGEVLLMTDADCIVNKKWIYSNAICFDSPNIAMIAACTNVNSNDFFSDIQAVEWLYLHTISMSSIGLNIPQGCFGNNISFSKKIIDNIGGYPSLEFSVTEDLAMMLHIFKKGYGIKILSSYDSTVNTQPNKTLKEYINQHHRWIIGGISLGYKAVLFVIISLAIWCAIILPLFYANYQLSLIAILIRGICDIALVLPTIFRIKRLDLIKMLIPSFIFIALMELLAPFLTLKKNVKWKNQTFNAKKVDN